MAQDRNGNNHKAAGRSDGGQFDRKAGQGSNDDLDLDMVDAPPGLRRHATQWRRLDARSIRGLRTRAERRTPPSAAMPHVRRLRPMARHDEVMRKGSRRRRRK